MGVAWIDAFFDEWLPFFVDMVRTLNRGIEAARLLHEEVISKDGISRPTGKHLPSDDAVGVQGVWKKQPHAIWQIGGRGAMWR